MSKPGFMSMRWLRAHIKEIIWATVILFLLSLFVIGYGTTKMTQQNEEKQERYDKALADEESKASTFPEHLVNKLNLPVVHVSYPTQVASLTTIIDVKTLWKTMTSFREFNEIARMPKGIKEYYLGMFKERAINDLVIEALADMYATVEKIKPTNVDALVQAEMTRISPVEFNRRLRNEGKNIDDFKSEKTRELILKAISEKIIKPIPVASATDELLKHFYEDNKDRYALEDKISFNHLLIAADDFVGKTNIAETEINKYYETHKADFMSGTRVKVSQIQINYLDSAYLDTIPVSETDLRDLYEKNKNQYMVKEAVRARHILIKPIDSEEDPYPQALAKIESILQSAKDGETFESLAKEFSQDSSSVKGGDLGEFARGVMVPAFEDAAFNAKIGEITAPVKTQFGYHIIKVEDKKPESVKTFEEVKADITFELKLKQAEIKAANALEEAKAQIKYQNKEFASFMNLSNVASAKNKGSLPSFFAGKITEDYAAEDAKILKNEIGDYSGRIIPEIEEAVFALNSHELSEIIQTSKGFHLFKLEEKLPPIQFALSTDIKNEITQILEKEAIDKLAAEKAKELKKNNSNARVLELAKAYNLEKEQKNTFEDLPYSKNPGYTSYDLTNGSGIFSDNGRTYVSEFHTVLTNLLKDDWKNKVAGPFQSQFGWHFVEITAYESNRYETFEAVKDSIRHILVFEPNADEIDKFYEENKEQLKISASRSVRQIILQSETDANDIYNRLNAGEIFGLLAKNYSSDAQAGALVNVDKNKLPADLANAIWALDAKGKYTAPIKTAYGYVITLYEGTEVLEGTRPLSEVSTGIRHQLRQEYQMKAFNSFFNGLSHKAYVTRNEKLLKEL